MDLSKINGEIWFDGIDNDGDGSDGQGLTMTEDVFAIRAYSVGDTVVTIDYETYERSLVQMPSDSLIIPTQNSMLVFKPGEQLEDCLLYTSPSPRDS